MKPLFINLNTVHFLDVCNAVKPVSSAHHIRGALTVTHIALSNRRQAFYPKTKVLSSFKTKSSPSYSTSNPKQVL